MILRFFPIFVSALFFLSILVSTEAFAEKGENNGVLVWKLEKKRGVNTEDIDSVSDFITAEVEKYAKGRVISTSEIDTILEGEAAKQRCGKNESSCMAEIGAAMGVPRAISGNLARMGDYWVINLRLVNVLSAVVEARVGDSIRGDINTLVEAVPRVVKALFIKSGDTEEVKQEVKKQEPIKVDSTHKKPIGKLAIAGYSTLAAGAALVVLGGVGTYKATSAKSDYDDSRGLNTDAKSSYDTWKAVSISGYVIGGAAIATGITLVVIDAMSDTPEEPKAFNFDFAPSKNGFYAGFTQRW